jgi:hypothetical protein
LDFHRFWHIALTAGYEMTDTLPIPLGYNSSHAAADSPCSSSSCFPTSIGTLADWSSRHPLIYSPHLLFRTAQVHGLLQYV